MPRWATEILEGHQALADLSGWWDTQPAARANPLLNSHVLRAWQDGMEERGSKLVVTTLKRDGEVVAGLPLYKTSFRYRTLLRRHLSAMDVVTSPGDDVDAHLPEWIDKLGVAYLYRLPDESPLVAASESRPRWSQVRRIACPYVDLSGGMDPVRDGWSKNFRKGLERRRRRLEERGEVRYVGQHTGTDLAAALDRGFELEAAGWKGKRGTAARSLTGVEGWFRDVADIADRNGWLRVGGIYLDDRMLAFCFDLQVGQTRHSLISAYDEDAEIAPLSPGNALVLEVLEDSAASGVGMYELGYGSRAWKDDWTKKRRYVNDVLAVGPGLTGRAFSVAKQIRG